jgi:hypothetical protein
MRLDRGAAAALLLLAGAGAGCHGCRDDHPYVPYTIGSSDGAPGASDDGGAPVPTAGGAADAGGPFIGEPAVAVAAGSTRATVDGVTIEAPDGMVLVLALVRDFDGDGAKDAFGVARPRDGNDPGEVVFYRGEAGRDPTPSAKTLEAPAGLARDPSCTPVDRLLLVGRSSVLVELGSRCPLHASTTPVRWVAVLDARAHVRLAATIADPPGAPALTVDADGSDRDGDGRDDVALRVTLEGGGAPLEPGPRVSAVFAWLDRPAGLSRDTAATDASFGGLSALAMVRATRAKEAPAVPALVAQVRSLWRAACADGGAPRLVGVEGIGAITCSAARALEEAGLAEVRAYATSGDPLRAALALDGAQQPPAGRTASRTKDAQGWVAQAAPAVTARVVRVVAAVPLAQRGHEPSWGSLAFEASGKLLVRTRAGLVRIDPDQGDEASADGAADWKPAVVSPDGATRWIEAYDACDGIALRATFAPTGDGDMHDVALPVAPPLGDRCSGSRGAPARATPIAWGPKGLEAVVAGIPVLVAPDLSGASPLAGSLDQPVTPGAPRSPDGKTLVVPTSAGIVQRGPARTRLLRASELDGSYAEQHDCTSSNDGTHVACVRAGRAWVGTWEGF